MKFAEGAYAELRALVDIQPPYNREHPKSEGPYCSKGHRAKYHRCGVGIDCSACRKEAILTLARSNQ